MNVPSMVSSSDIPAANSTGRHRIAYQGRPEAAPEPARTSSATSVAVSKPRPNSRPSGHLPRLGDRLHHPAQQAVHEPAMVQLLLQCRLVEVAGAHLPEDLPEPGQDHHVDEGDHVEEHTGDGRADPARDVVQLRVVVLHRPGQALDAEGEQEGQGEDDAGVPEGEPETHRQRPPAGVHQLAGRVVDRRDVVGVEGVPHPQGVGGHPDPDTEGLRAQAVVLRGHEHDQGEPADGMQGQDDGGHPTEPPPLMARNSPCRTSPARRTYAGDGGGTGGRHRESFRRWPRDGTP